MRLNELITTNKILITDFYWLIAQVSLVLRHVSFKFLALFLVINQFSEHQILGFFSVLFFFNIFGFYIVKKIPSSYDKMVFLLLIIAALIGFYLYYIFQHLVYLSIAMIAVELLSSVFNINSLTSIVRKAEKDDIDSQKIISLSGLYFLIIPNVFIFLIGFVLSYNNDYFIYILMSFLIVLLLLIVKRKISVNHNLSSFKNNYAVHCVAGLSLFYNVLHFLGLFFIIPIFILKISEIYNISNNIFSLMGIFLGVIGLINLINKMFVKARIVNSHFMMFINYFLLTVSWIIIAAVFYFIEQDNNNLFLINSLIVTFLLFYSVIEVSSKLWTIGFLDTLKKYSTNYDNALSLFIMYKNIGTFLGFFVSYLLYSLLPMSMVVLLIGISVFMYGVFSIIYLKKNQSFFSANFAK